MKKFLMILIILIGAYALAFAREDITITSFPLSPYGIYKGIRLSPIGTAVGGCQEGELHYDDSSAELTPRGVYYCDQTGNWKLVGGANGRWTLETAPDPNRLYVTDDNSRVGIGTMSPEFKLTLDNDGGIFAKGFHNTGYNITTTGAGTRLIWYPKRGAFRAGGVTGNQWDIGNIEHYSIGLGYNVIASNDASIAMGWEAEAGGTTSLAMGYKARALALGGDYSVAIGSRISSEADRNVVIGQGVSDSNRLANDVEDSLAVGFNTTVPTLFVSPSAGGATTGNVGIGGITNPTYKLEVNGNAAKSVGGSRWLIPSDIRIKTDIQDIDNGLDIISRLRPIKFRYTKEYKENHPSIKDHYYFSFIAQEFQKVFPDSVEEGKDGYLMMDASAVTPYLVETVKELLKMVQELETENAALEKAIEEFK